ncbi:MAG: photosystem reaction center subunit H [Ruminiclostridium sp.]|nr:photosystem reaction center subunit H [Ruminiclostridium sp.]
MHRYSEVLNLPVVCVKNGKKTGVIKDIIFCPENREVSAFLLEHKGLEIRKKVVKLKSILNLGDDAVIIDSPDCVKSLGKAAYTAEFKDEGSILGLRIFTRAGEELGIVKDVIFDWQAGRIEGFEVSDGLLQDILQGRRILPLFGKVEFGEENILVDKEAVEEMENTGGGIRNKLNKI